MPAPTSVPRRAAPNAGMTCSFGAIAKVVVAVSSAENPTHSSVVVWRGSATVDGLHEISFRYFDRIVVLVRLVAVVADTPAPFEDAEPFGRRAPATFQSQAGGTDAPCSTPATTLQLSAGSMPTCENDRLPTVFPSDPEPGGSWGMTPAGTPQPIACVAMPAPWLEPTSPRSRWAG